MGRSGLDCVDHCGALAPEGEWADCYVGTIAWQQVGDGLDDDQMTVTVFQVGRMYSEPRQREWLQDKFGGQSL